MASNAERVREFLRRREAEEERFALPATRERFRTDPANAPVPSYGEDLNALRRRQKAELEAVREDGTLAKDYRRNRLFELEREHKEARDEEARRVFAMMSEDKAALEGTARPRRTEGSVQEELLRESRLRRYRDELEDELRTRKPSVVMYEELLEEGDDLRVEVFEKVAPGHLPGPENYPDRMDLAGAIAERREAAMEPAQRAASEGLRRLEARWDDVAMGLHVRGEMPGGIPDASATPRSPHGLIPPQREE